MTTLEDPRLPGILADPFYGPAFATLGSIAAIDDAGYFDPGPERIPPAPREWMSVPLIKILDRLADPARDPARPVAVLLTTGAFNPPHLGHVQLMNSARAELELRGYHVAGGYLSPSHDAYVSTKCGAQAQDAVTRLALCQVVTAASEWLMTADWEALGVDRAVNFTDVILWLEAYLARHIDTTAIEVFYVFGSDNARFARTFLHHGRCVCTVRPGHAEAAARYAAEPHVRGNPRILFARQASVLASSSMIRTAARTDLMEERSREHYTRPRAPPRHATYVLRDECGWEVAPWSHQRDPEQMNDARRWFHDRLTDLLRRVHATVGTTIDFHWLRLDEQSRRVRALAGANILSIDAPLPGSVDLAVSRRFALSGARIGPTLSHRPGSPPLATQIAAIPRGSYVLLDDDVCTGATLAGVRALLPDHVHIESESILFRKDPARGHLDVLDCRDFLPGARDGGLVVGCPDGDLARAPYCLPYVSACERASVPLREELTFSRDLWRLGAAFFARIDPAITLAEADPAFARLMRHLGFPPDTEMAALCRWHADEADLTVQRADPRRSPP